MISVGKKYFISDFHFGDDAWKRERTQFKNEEEHTTNLLTKIGQWADKLNKDKTNEIWVLGDYGNINFLWAMDAFECKKIFVYGNHDKAEDFETFELYFDEVYKYPQFLSQKLVVSHFPVAVWDSAVCVAGHLHACKIALPNYISCSVNDRDYKLVTEREISSAFSRIPKFCTRFLWEPWSDLPQRNLNLNRKDIVFNPATGIIDIAASRCKKSFDTSKNFCLNPKE